MSVASASSPVVRVTQAPGPAHRTATESNPPHSTAYNIRHVTPGPVSAKPVSHTPHASLLHVGTGAPKIRVCSRLTVFRRKHTENKTRGCIRLDKDKGKEPSPMPRGRAPAEGCLSRVFVRTSQPAIIRHFCQ